MDVVVVVWLICLSKSNVLYALVSFTLLYYVVVVDDDETHDGKNGK